MKLSLADLEGKLKSEGHLRQADLDKSKLRGIRQPNADFAGASLKGAELSKGDLSGANLSGADLTGADLRKTNLSGADLTGARLEKADLDECVLTGAKLDRAVFSGAKLRKATLGGGSIADADFTEADLTAATIAGGSLSKCRLAKTNLQEATLTGGLALADCDFTGAVFSLAALDDVRVSGGTLADAELYSTTFKGVRFEGVDATGTNFSASEFTDVALGFASVKKANFKSVSGLSDEVLADLKGKGAAISRKLLRRVGVFVWKSVWAKLIVLALIAGAGYAYYAYQNNPKNWGFEQLIDAARTARNGGDLARAKKLLDVALAKYKTTYRESQILFMQADLAADMKDYPEAERLFKLVISDYPDNEDTIFNANVRIAEINADQGKTDDAIEHIRKVIQDWEFYYGIGNAYRVLADIYMKRAEPDKAYAAIQEFIGKHQDDKKFVYEGNRLLAELYQRANRQDDALRVYLAMIASGVEEESPHWVYMRVADIYLVQGKIDDAEKTYKEVIAKYPKIDDAQINALWGMARIAERRGDIAGATKLVQQVIDRFPKSDSVPGLMITLANYYQSLGKNDEARAVYAKMESRFGTSRAEVAQAYFGRARIAVAGGDTEGALKIFDQILARFVAPEIANNARAEKARALMGVGRYDEASALLAQVEKDPAARPETVAGVMRDQAEILARQGKPDEAMARFRAIRERYGDQDFVSWVTEAQANLERDRGHFDAAFALYQDAEVRAMASGDANRIVAVKTGIANLYRQQGKREEALKLYEETLAAYGATMQDTGWIREAIATLLMELGKLAEARAAYEKMAAAAGVDARVKAQALAGIADIAQRQGNTQDALARYRDLVQNYRNAENFAYIQGNYVNLLLTTGKVDEALKLLSDQLEACRGARTPLCREVRLGLARIYENRHDFAKAQEFYEGVSADFAGDPAVVWTLLNVAQVRRARGDREGATQLYRKMIAECDARPEQCRAAYVALAQIAAESGRTDEAVGLYRELFGKLKGRIRMEGSEVDLGFLYLNRRDFPVALKIFETYVSNPDPGIGLRAEMGLAQVYRQTKRYPEALKAYADIAARAQDPGMLSDAIAEAADLNARMGRREVAIGMFEDALKRFAGRSEFEVNLLNSLAGVYQAAGQWSKAAEIYQRIVARPGTGASQVQWAMLNLARLYQNNGQYDKAEATYKTLDGSTGLDDSARINVLAGRADLAVTRGQLQKANEIYDQILTKWPRHESVADVTMMKANALVRLGRSAEAEKLLADVLAKYGTDQDIGVRALDTLARLKMEQGKSEEARKYFQELTARTKGTSMETWTLLSLVRLHFDGKRFDEAKKVLDSLPKDLIGEQRVAVYNWYSNIAQARGNADEAIAYQRKLIAEVKDPNVEASGLRRIAQLLQEQGKRPESLAIYRDLLRRFPENREINVAAHMATGFDLVERGQAAKAIDEFNAIASKFAGQDEGGWALLEVARAQLRSRQADAAAQTYARLQKEYADNAEIQGAIVSELADVERQRGNLPKAIELLRATIDRQKNPVVKTNQILSLARLYAETKDVIKAKESIDRILKAQPAPSPQTVIATKRLLLDVLDDAGDVRGAIALAEGLMKQYPGEDEAGWIGLVLAGYYERLGQREPRLALFRDIRTKWGSRNLEIKIQAAIGESRVLLETGRADEAVKVIESLRREVGDRPQTWGILLQLGIVYHHLNQPAKSQQAYELLTTKFPRGSEPYNAGIQGLADAAMQDRDSAKAIRLFTEIAQGNPGTPVGGRARLNIGRIYLNEGRNAAAAEVFKEAARTYAKFPDIALDAKIGIGQIQERAWKYEDALKTYSEVIAASPDSRRAINALRSTARLYLDTGRVEKAEESFAKMLDLGTSLKDAEIEMDARMGIADMAARQRMYDEAAKQYKAIIQRSPQTERAGWAKAKLGDMALERKDYAQAERVYSEVLGEFPGYRELSFAALNGLAQLKTAREDFNGAIDIHKRIIATDPNDPRAGWAMVQIARIYVRDKEYDKAGVLVDQVVRKFAGDKNILGAAGELRQKIKASTMR
jgi:tetratricopeptide (TPR) repeat protein